MQRSGKQADRCFDSHRGLVDLGLLREWCLVALLVGGLAWCLALVPQLHEPAAPDTDAESAYPVQCIAVNTVDTEICLLRKCWGLTKRSVLDGSEETVLRDRSEIGDFACFLGKQETVCVVGHIDGSVDLWWNGRLVWAEEEPRSDSITSVAVADGGRFAIAATASGELVRLRRDGPRVTASVIDTGIPIARIQISPDGRWLAMISGNEEVFVWDIERDCERARWTTPGVRCSSVAWSPCGRKLATTGSGGQLCLWDVESQQPLWQRQADLLDPLTATFSPCGRFIATGGFDCRVRVWDADSGERVTEFPSHKAAVRALAYNPTGRTIYSGGYDGRVIANTL